MYGAQWMHRKDRVFARRTGDPGGVGFLACPICHGHLPAPPLATTEDNSTVAPYGTANSGEPIYNRSTKMPVFTRVKDGVLVLTVDGDYTPNELRRVAFSAFEDSDTPSSVPILLDMSGAAGLGGKSTEELRASGAIFGAFRDRISGIGVVAASDVHPLFAPTGDFGREAGVSIRACQSHADAREFLGQES